MNCARLLAVSLPLALAISSHAQVVTQGRTYSSTQIGAAPAPWSPGAIEVFASSAMYLANAERATVYRIDARKQLLAEINQGGLPPDPKRAEAIARERMRAMGPEFKRRIEASLVATEKVMVYGIRRVPAIVFDGQRVVYGVTDVTQATELARRGLFAPIGARFVPGKKSPAGSAR